MCFQPSIALVILWNMSCLLCTNLLNSCGFKNFFFLTHRIADCRSDAQSFRCPADLEECVALLTFLRDELRWDLSCLTQSHRVTSLAPTRICWIADTMMWSHAHCFSTTLVDEMKRKFILILFLVVSSGYEVGKLVPMVYVSNGDSIKWSVKTSSTFSQRRHSLAPNYVSSITGGTIEDPIAGDSSITYRSEWPFCMRLHWKLYECRNFGAGKYFRPAFRCKS